MVVDKFVIQLEVQLADRQVTIELTDEARKWLAEKGYDQRFGARPLSRVIQEHIKKPLAEELLFGRLEKGGVVRVKLEDRKLAFEYLEPAKADPRPRKRGSKTKQPAPTR
jgi:ATP-dependent Clp protease ATP-binding subunit ClpA